MRTWGLALILWAVSLLPAGAEELRLEDLVTVALKNNPDISAASARAGAARQRISRDSEHPFFVYDPKQRRPRGFHGQAVEKQFSQFADHRGRKVLCPGR